MKKEILTEVNRNREIMGLGPNRLLNESIIGGVDDLIKLVTRKLSVSGTDAATRALTNQFTNLTNAGVKEADKLGNILAFVKSNSKVFDDLFMRDFRKIFISKLPQGVQDEITILKNAIEAGSVREDEIYDLLTDSSGGIMRNADNESVNFMEDYLKTFLTKSTPNVGGVATKLEQMAQINIQRFADEIDAAYTVTLSQGGKKAEIVRETVNKIRSLSTLTPEGRIQIGKELQKEIDGVKDLWLKKYLSDLWKESRMVRFSIKSLAGILTLLLVNEIIEKLTGLDFNTAIIGLVGSALSLLKSFMPDEDYQEVKKRVKNKIPEEQYIPVTKDDKPSGSGSSGGDSSGGQ